MTDTAELMITSSDITITRKRTTVEREVSKRKYAAHEVVRQLHEPQLPDVSPYIPQALAGAIFVGHLVTDLDSIAGAIGAAEFYGGVAGRASNVNSETKFALDYWKVEQPVPIEELLVSYPKAAVCLVDHQQTSQLNPSIDVNRIVGVIDHHALQNATIVTDMPIYIDIRPWGSMSTIIAHTFTMNQRSPTRSTAGMLLCAILSDTLNLQGPTTTEWDRMMVTILAEIAGVDDLQTLASSQFKAKSSELAFMTAEALVTGDQKVFTFKTDKFEGSVGFAVVETTDDEVIVDRAPELLKALRVDKKTKGLSMLYLGIVNIVELKTTLLLCDESERSLALAAFPDGNLVFPSFDELEDNMEDDVDIEQFVQQPPSKMNLGKLVSRKKDFIPAITRAIKSGWSDSECSLGTIKRSSSDVFDLNK